MDDQIARIGAIGLLLVGFQASSVAAVTEDPAGFDDCLVELRRAALDEGIPGALTNEVLDSLEFQPRVIELDRAQPELHQTLAAYLRSRITSARIERGRELMEQHRNLLMRLHHDYGIPGQYLVALWGMESNFGRNTGNMPTLDSLATLACDPRRSTFFRTELLFGLRLIERERLQPEAMRGSWAGAMGQTQFMPSAYYEHAVDGDGDGRIDLWNNPADALASGAKLLQSLGWQTGQRWGREIRLPEDFAYERIGAGQTRSLTEWAALGVRQADGRPLPEADMSGPVLVPMGHAGPAFLVYANFEVIMGWNRSTSFAIAVGHLADRIAGTGPLRANFPKARQRLATADIATLQNQLISLGYAPGKADGILGPSTRSTLREFQLDHGLVPDGYPDEATTTALTGQSETEPESDE
ncbi:MULTISPECIES: lytic murein transglycosylase [unclassified Wenzhouxiangella]|uniref:lytic murein transglycosylase n=1 Tax=unclassified Wenzhouxiangella TaxID=2613841 RepID=UPI000E325A67|nr:MULTISPECIES: lytic murein transglycosylase [unclassified Wenzhouxiangella]RFF26568.1 lytic murein transglycosylase [Wenzhouxiangella sp. 15181]RFP70385.1 lytic murein transglycosylase [Wenzhouxiangella sp. 15190]